MKKYEIILHDLEYKIKNKTYQEVVKGSFKAINKELEDGSKVKIDNEINEILKK